MTFQIDDPSERSAAERTSRSPCGPGIQVGSAGAEVVEPLPGALLAVLPADGDGALLAAR